jgi:hypothetical protein
MLGATMYGQGVTTSSINGRISDSDGEPLIGANITAIHTPSGSFYGNTTDFDGFFRISNMRVGGPYTVTISYTGFEDDVRENVYLRLGQAFQIDSDMTSSSVVLNEIAIVSSSTDIFDGNRTGAQTSISEDVINQLPTVSRSLGDFTRLTPQSTATEGNDGFAISFAGQNNRFNAIYIDGAVSNDVFGLAGSGTNGGQTGVSPISIDAIEEFQINLAPFDVRIGGFAGAAVSAITRSGSNKTQGSVYTFWRNESLAGRTPTDNDQVVRERLDDFTARTSGFRLGGALVKNKLFYFINAEIQRETTPLPFAFEDYIGDSDQAALSSLENKLINEFGYDPGTFTNNRRFLNSEKYTGRLDWNINNNHKLAFKLSSVLADNLEGVQSNASNIRFLNSSERFDSRTTTASLELNSIISPTLSNNLTIGYTAVRDDRDPNGEPFPFVLIEDGSAEISFGSERFSTANLLNQDIFTITDNLSIYKGKHTFTVGTHNEFYSVDNLFLAFNYGSYEYANLNAFLNDENSSFFIRNFSLVDNISGDDSEAIASFNAGQLGVYLQDEIQVSNKLKVTGGIRLDLPFYGSTPGNDAFNNETIPLLEAEGYDLRGARVGEFIQSRLQFSPRIGFNYDFTGENKSQLRGGVGLFTSRAPLVWVGGAYNNYGLNVGTALRFGDLPFNPQWDAQEPGAIDLNNVQPSGSVDLFAEDFKLPQFLKANLAYDYKIGNGWVLGLDALYNKTVQNVAYQNLNLRPSTTRATGTPDDRLLYDRRDEIDDTYDRILLGYNISGGYSYNLSGTLSKQFSNDFYGQVSYSYGDSFSVFDGTSSQNSSQWRGLHTVNGRNVEQPVRRSDFSAGSRFIAFLSYTLNWSENIGTTVSIFHESAAGSPYSYIYNDGGNFNNEDSRERSLIYVPASSDEIILVDDNGITPEQQWTALDEFISNDPYLSTRRGQYAERNSNRGPWSHVMDLKFIQDIATNIGGSDHKLQFTVDIFNFTNLLNSSWGRRNFVGSFGSAEILDFEGFQNDTEPTFTFNSNRLNEDGELVRIIDDNGIQSSRWQLQLGVRYLFN